MRRCIYPESRMASEWYAQAALLPQGWDAGLPDGHFLTIASLCLHESIRLPDVNHSYAGLKGPDGTYIARAAFQILSLRPEHVRRSAMPGWQWAAWSRFTKIFRPKLLVGGHLFRHDVETVWYDKARLQPFDAFVWYQQVIGDVMKECRVQAVLLKEPPGALIPLFLHHAPDYLLLRADGSMQMRIFPEWQSLRDYEKSLKHKYAQRLRKVRQSWDTLTVGELDEAEVRRHAGEMFSLYEQVASNQPVRVGLLNEAFLPVLKSFYGERLKVWGIREGDSMIAFASAWVHEDRFDMFYIGFDYARNTELQLYFNILFFAVEQAILHQAPLLILGRTALEAKARVGCRPVYLNTFLHIRNPLLRGIVKRLQGRFSEQDTEWEQRHPFKKELHEM